MTILVPLLERMPMHVDHIRSNDPGWSVLERIAEPPGCLPDTDNTRHNATAVLKDLGMPLCRASDLPPTTASRRYGAGQQGHKSGAKEKNEAIESSNDGWMYGAHGRNTRTNCKGGRSKQENRGHV
jgi:hypothetical protein